jgi:hypothetical protein
MKTLPFILLFLLGFLSSNTVFAVSNKAIVSKKQTINNIPKHKKTSYLEKIFSRKIGERKTMRLLALPTRYVVNTIIMAVSQLQTSITEKIKKIEDNNSKLSEIIVNILEGIGAVISIAASIYLAYFLFSLLGFSLLFALLAGIGSVLLIILALSRIRC